MKHNLEGRVFRSTTNTANGEVSPATLFSYHQDTELVWADYGGGEIIRGNLMGKWNQSGRLEFAYHHINRAGGLMIGRCQSTPEMLHDGRLRFHEKWQWISGDQSSGESVVEEVAGE